MTLYKDHRPLYQNKCRIGGKIEPMEPEETIIRTISHYSGYALLSASVAALIWYAV